MEKVRFSTVPLQIFGGIMSAEIASLERVRQAADALRRRGVRPTADRIIETIGGGGKSTVLEHLRVLRNAPPENEDLPSSVIELIRGGIEDVYRAGRAAEAEKVRAGTERLLQVVAELDAQVQELVDDNARSERHAGKLEIQAAHAAEAQNEMSERLLEVQVENGSLKEQLAAARATASEELRSALGRVEDIVRSAARRDGPDAGLEGEVSAPNKQDPK
tara:strand:- start:1526 stop:2182 length:657 start_codon:yes stop_codon:yes gene_type:complete